MPSDVSAATDTLRSARDRATSRVPDPVQRLGRWLTSPEFVTTSAGLAFYAMISIPPMVLIAFWVAGVFISDSELQQLGEQVDAQAPDQLPVGTVLQGLIDVAASVGWVAVVTAVWPATAYGAALARAFTQVAPESERQIRGWRGRLFALILIAVLPLVVFAALATLYVLPRVLGSGWLLTAVLAVGAFAVLAVVIAGIFALFQVHDTRWDDVALAALATTGLIAVSTAGYLLYLELFADFTERYGSASLATTVLLALWLLVGNAVLLVGYRLMHRRALSRRDGDDVEHRRG